MYALNFSVGTEAVLRFGTYKIIRLRFRKIAFVDLSYNYRTYQVYSEDAL
jgi:hypothetical protein